MHCYARQLPPAIWAAGKRAPVRPLTDRGPLHSPVAGTIDRMNGEPDPQTSEGAPTPDAERFEIVDVPEQRRYEVRVGGRVVGHARYVVQNGTIALLHTEIDPSMEGRGIGSRLAAGVLADVTSRDLSVVVRCPFIAAYVRRHPQDYPGVELRD